MDMPNSSYHQYDFIKDAGKGTVEKEIVFPKATIGEHFIRIGYYHYPPYTQATDVLQFKIIPQFD